MLISKLNINSPDLNVMLKACLKASRSIIRDFGEIEHLQMSQKSLKTFTANTDKKAEKIIHTVLKDARPQHGFLLEEGGEIKGQNDFRWIVDPLDGSNNFANAIPNFAISIALEYRSEIISGMIYNPITNDLFYAEKNCGAFVNDKKMRMSTKENNTHKIIGLSLPHKDSISRDKFYALLSNIPENISIRISGSAALDLCSVAKGTYKGYYSMDSNYWDIAAGSIIIKEAAGKITNCHNKSLIHNNDGCIAGTLHTHNELTKLMT